MSSLNNTSNLSNHKKNLKRMNRLHDKNDLNSFDNHGFQNDISDDASSLENGGGSVEEMNNKLCKENQTKTSTHRRLSNPKALANTVSSRDGSNQNVLEPESIELQVKDGSPKQKETRRALESVNTDASVNANISDTKADDSSEENDFVPPISPLSKEKPPKMAFKNNMKRFNLLPSHSAIQERLRMSRPSLTVDMALLNRTSIGDSVDGSNFTRSRSMREGGHRPKPRQRLLRDISFSDADDSVTKDYGSLKNINLPKRHGDEPVRTDAVCVLETLMQDLIKRGKVHHVAILDKEKAEVLAAIPSGLLTKADALGMVKSTICPPSLFKIRIADVDYNCFKHRHDAVQGRAPDIVMVMQMTETCVVVGFSRDDAPGSCNSEVNEFAKVLEDAGW